MNQLHPGARWIFRLNAYSRFGSLFFLLIYFIIIFYFMKDKDSFFSSFLGNSFLMIFFFVFFFTLIMMVIAGEIYARMSYNRWFYEITHEAVKIEHGIIWKKYTSIPYKRIQNIDIRRGIIARIFGFSTVDIETAGRSGSMNSYSRSRRGHQMYKSEGHLPAIDTVGAEKIREFVMKKIKHLQSGAGLG